MTLGNKSFDRQEALYWIYALPLCLLPIFSILTANGYGLAPPGIFLLALAVLFRSEKTMPTRVDVPLLIASASLPLLALASYFWAAAPDKIPIKATKELLLFLSGFGLFALSTAMDDAKRQRLCRFFAACFALTALLLLEELLGRMPLFRLFKDIPPDGRLGSGVLNRAAVVLSLFYWPFLYFMIRQKRAWLGAATGIFIFAFVVLLGQSETAMMAFAAGGIAFACARYLPRLVFGALLGIIILLSLGAPFIYQWAYRHFGSDLSAWQSANAGARLDIWNAVSVYALQKPLYGYGMEATRSLTDLPFDKFYTIRDEVSHPHNNFLQVWIEFGAIGALWLAGFLSFLLLRLRKLPPLQYATAIGCFTAALTISLVGYGLWQAWWPGLLFMTAAMLKIAFGDTR